MNPCKYFDDGWCYAPDDVETGAHQGACCASFCSYYIKKQQMTINLHDYVDKEVIVTYRNGIDVVSKVYHTNDASFCQYHYGISDRWYTRDGRVLIDQESPLDIISIVTVEENDKNFENSKQIIDKTMTEKEEIQSKITSLQKQLAAIEEEEKSKSPAEEAYKLWWGEYPTNTWQGDVNRWEAFQTGYNAAKKENVNEIEELYQQQVVKQKEEYPYKKYTPEETEQSLKKAFREAVKQGVVSSTTEQQTLYEICMEWCDDEDNPPVSFLIDRIEQWLPKPQSAEGSQNSYVECTVEGWNDCLKTIKRKLR